MFLHSFHPSPILLDLGLFQIHWYGFLVTLGIILGFFVFYKLARRVGFEKNFVFNLFFWLVIWGLIGGRLYHVLSEINYYWQHPLQVFYVWHGGLGIYGSVVAGIFVVFVFLKNHPLTPSLNGSALQNKEGTNKTFPLFSVFFFLDFLAPALALGQALGRWGNYFNQELYGLPTNLPWGIPIDLANRAAGYENFQFFHPVFLYESLFCLGLFIILLFLVRKRRDAIYGVLKIKSEQRDAINRVSTKNVFFGSIFLLYLFLYSLWRFLIEFLRIDPQPVWHGLRLGQWVSLVIILVVAVVYFLARKWYNKSIKAIEH